MAGTTRVTQASFQVSALTTFTTRVTQAALQAGVTTNFKTRVTQAALTASVWTTFKTRVTQSAIVAWVMTCDSSSYVPPASTGIITLTATPGDVGDQWVDLSWTGLGATFVYTLQRGTEAGVYTDTLLTASTATTYHDDSVNFHQQYYYLVTAVNVCEDQTVSNEGSATPECTLPGRPIRLHATADNDAGVIRLIWNPVPIPF